MNSDLRRGGAWRVWGLRDRGADKAWFAARASESPRRVWNPSSAYWPITPAWPQFRVLNVGLTTVLTP